MLPPAYPELLPIKSIDWDSLIPLLGQANRGLSDYNGMLRHLPNAQMLLAPLTVQEAVLSSRIEGTLATMSEVLRFEAGELPLRETRQRDIEEILNYREAMRHAVETLETKPFHLNLLLALHKILLSSVRGQNKAPGHFRRIQNFIGERIGGVESIRFTPPEPQLLLRALDNWERYYHAEEKDPLVQLAVIHAQFEFLHPFLDGNGRLGRILIPIFLYEHKLLRQPNFYLSEFIEAHRDEYVDRLHQLGRSKTGWTEWVRFFLRAVIAQSAQNARRAEAMLALYQRLKAAFLDSTRSPYAVPLLDFIFTTPVFQPNQVVLAGMVPSKPTLTSLLQTLHRAGHLTMVREGAGRRSYIWELSELIELSERSFADGAP